MTNEKVVNLVLSCKRKFISNFINLLGRGFRIKIESGHSIRDLFSRQLGLDPEYLEKRIQTLFLNGKVVDDVDSAVINDGSVLALSAAMPGVLGATLRKSGFFATMRSQISYRAKTAKSLSDGQGEMVLKLFNMVAVELGPIFLKQGIVIKGCDFKRFLDRIPRDFSEGRIQAEVDGNKIHFDELIHTVWEAKDVFFRLNIENGA